MPVNKTRNGLGMLKRTSDNESKYRGYVLPSKEFLWDFCRTKVGERGPFAGKRRSPMHGQRKHMNGLDLRWKGTMPQDPHDRGKFTKELEPVAQDGQADQKGRSKKKGSPQSANHRRS